MGLYRFGCFRDRYAFDALGIKEKDPVIFIRSCMKLINPRPKFGLRFRIPRCFKILPHPI